MPCWTDQSVLGAVAARVGVDPHELYREMRPDLVCQGCGRSFDLPARWCPFCGSADVAVNQEGP